jgi:hypothetical protein
VAFFLARNRALSERQRRFMPEHTPPREPWHEPITRLFRGAVELLSHTSMLALILLAVWLIEQLTKKLWGKDLQLLGKVPLAYLLQGSDLLLLTAFLTIGIWVVLSAYYRRGK